MQPPLSYPGRLVQPRGQAGRHGPRARTAADAANGRPAGRLPPGAAAARGLRSLYHRGRCLVLEYTWRSEGARRGLGSPSSCPPLVLYTCPSSLPKILQHQAALLAAAQGPGLGPVAAVAAQMQHVAAFSLVAAPLLPAAGTARRGRGRAGPGRGWGQGGASVGR